MRYRLLMHMDIEAKDENEALVSAKKLGELLKNPVVRISLESDGIRPVTEAVVYRPTIVK